jgi:hypothetical protein
MKFFVFFSDFQKSKIALDTCIYCLKDDSRPQVAMVSLGYRAYLALPNIVEMTQGHCLIVPVQHVTSTLECDDDVWDEIRVFYNSFNLIILNMFIVY